MLDPLDICQSCGQRTSYRSRLSKGVAKTLLEVAKKIKEKGINIISLKKELLDAGIISVNQYGNRTHMVRLGLIIDADEVGNYILTRRGLDFLNGVAVPAEAVVYKSTLDKHSHTEQSSEEVMTIAEAMSGEFWQVPGFDIQEGKVIIK